ncbi:MAG: saccharopine dehydrogenase C-terminal domain-containing protein [Calditrichia bacterium]
MKIIVLGSGRVGSAMAIDLARDKQFQVSVADISKKNLEKLTKTLPFHTIQSDLSESENIEKLVSGYDLVVNAVPGFMGYETFRAVIEAGKDIVDIAFFPEDPFQLNKLAVERGVTAIMDCGVAPGMSNILIGYVDHLLDKTEKAVIYVGGLPSIREWPYEYKAVFSPVDVIEEYTRPARYVENGCLVTRPALSDPEFLNFPGIGTLEAFNTDGLRTLIQTIDAPDMKEKTLRYPGHIEKIAVLRETGFFSQEPIEIGGSKIRPLDFTAKLLFPMWEQKEGEEDITVMKVQVEGKRDGKHMRYTYNLFDRYNPETKTPSMSRTTGYTATMAVRMIAEGLYKKKGVSAPEFIGQQPECVDFILKGLKERDIIYRETVEEIH